MDVTSLYPYISNSEGNSAAKGAYESYPEKFIATIIITNISIIEIESPNLLVHKKKEQRLQTMLLRKKLTDNLTFM